ncbi:hypothetical protein FPT15_20515 [Pseudomonas sp. RGB]|nr:hypothetical protein FPT15_20515 [Pseudomonas sp. RGB]
MLSRYGAEGRLRILRRCSSLLLCARDAPNG